MDGDREFSDSHAADSATAGGEPAPDARPATSPNDQPPSWAPHPIPELAPRPAPSWDVPSSVPPDAPGWAALTPGWEKAPHSSTPPSSAAWTPPTPGWSPPQSKWSAPPDAWGPQGAGWQPGFGVAPPVPAASSRPLVVVLVVVVAVVVAASVGLLYARIAPGSTRSPAAASLPAGGRVVFTDDFRDSTSGWFTGQTSGGSTMSYTSPGYAIAKTATDPTDVFVAAPYDQAVNGLSMTATESISSGSSDTSGFGLICRRGAGADRIQYEFIVGKDGAWTVESRLGVPSLTTAPSELRTGTSPTPAGETPITLTATCDSTADGLTTRLIFVVAGSTVVDFLDKADALPGNGWFGGVVAAIDPPAATITVTRFEERETSI